MPENRRKEQTGHTRERIARIAMELFSQDGFEGVTVAEIARNAGVTEKTVFNPLRDQGGSGLQRGPVL